MSFSDNVKLIGDLTIQIIDANGVVKDTREIHNMVVDTGKNLIAGLIAGGSTKATYVALGSSNVAAAADQTTLDAEMGGTRRVFNSEASVLNVATFVTTYPTGTSGVYREAGLFTASTGGIMMCRTAFNAITKTTSDNLVITWNVRVN